MNKSLRDYTAGEIYDICKSSSDCLDCPLHRLLDGHVWYCPYSTNSPSEWELEV